MLHIGGKSFQSINNQFGERAFVLILFGKHTYFSGFGVEVFAYIAPGQCIDLWHVEVVLDKKRFESVAQLQSLFDTGGDAVVVEVGVGDGAEESIGVEHVNLAFHVDAVLAEQAFSHGDAAHHKEQKVLQSGSGGQFSANAFDEATLVFSGFLTLETKHLSVHKSKILLLINCFF